MSLAHYLFGFSGRANRAKQWAVFFVVLAQFILLAFAFAYTIGFVALGEFLEKKTTFAAVSQTPQARTFAIVFCVLYALVIYINLAVTTKRLHDRNKSAWWLLVFIALPAALNVPAMMQLPLMLQHMSEVMQAAQAHLPPPRMPYEPPFVILTRGAATIVSLWAFVELYILRGTEGDNRFGPDPLAPKA